jgi:glycosyltransferase involved in cell wall biosynthesis
MKVLFLYTEIAEYFLACCKSLLSRDVEVHIVRFPLNKEAPFEFTFPEGLHIYERNLYNDQQLLELVNTIDPSLIVCSGWTNKGYLNVCRQFKDKVPTVLTLDNHWRGDVKQQVARFFSPFYLHSRFSHCWVPGEPQEKYALKLGFKKTNILKGFYSCDFNFFHDQYIVNKQDKNRSFPKRFIYVGRYYEFKGINDLWNAFIELQASSPNEWELWCLGVGDIEPVKHPKIKHFGFVQPNDLRSFLKETGVFVLPSHFEPWGVVVHEYAAAGFPIICSDEVGARTAFVENNYNGYIYKSKDIDALKVGLKRIMDTTDAELNVMAEGSVEKARLITPESWAKQLMSLLK